MSIKPPEEYQKIVVDLVKELKGEGYDHDSDHPERVNPIVVALLVSPNGEIIQSYRSEAIEGDHAEYNLFMNKILGENHEEDTLYVSLEPCNYDSRLNTKSCSEIVVSAKIKKVYIGCFDPDILVKGNGYAYLKEKKVEVELFKEEYQKELIDANWDFFRSKLFENESGRRFYNNYKTLISTEMIDKYLSKIKEDVAKGYKEIDWNDKDEPLDKLYDHCSNKKYIFDDVKNGKRITSTDVGFDLAFLKDPTIRYKGAYIKLIDCTNPTEEIGSSVFNGPVLIAVEETIIEVKEITKKIFNDEDIDLCIRELLSNAVIHKDYNSYTPITIKIFMDSIEISNPCKIDFISLTHLNNYDMPTNLVNGCLAEIAFEMHLMECQGRGEETLKGIYKRFNKSERKPYELITNILKVTIPLK